MGLRTKWQFVSTQSICKQLLLHLCVRPTLPNDAIENKLQHLHYNPYNNTVRRKFLKDYEQGDIPLFNKVEGSLFDECVNALLSDT